MLDQTENVHRTMGIPLSNANWAFSVWSPGVPAFFLKPVSFGDHNRITKGLPDPFRLQSPISYEVFILRNLFLILLVVVAISCDDMRKPAMNVISEPVATEEPAPVVETQPLEITFENAFDLAPGIYRFRPNSYNSGTGDLGDYVITGLLWGSVDLGEEVEGSPPDAPKLTVYIELNPQPYEKMLNEKLAIEFQRLADGTVIVDELLVEIGEKLREGTEQGGEREYTYIVYAGTALENLTNPDRAFEYE